MPLLDTQIVIRSLKRNDLIAVQELILATETFRPDEKHVAEQVLRESLINPSPEGYISLVADLKGKLVGWISFGTIPCTVGSWDLYWIVVSRAHRKKSIGTSLLNEAERIMARERGRMILIETSSTPAYLPARSFYERMGYRQIARLPNCYAPGDDKIIYMKEIQREGE